MSRNPAKKITIAAVLKRPVAKSAAAQKFTTSPIKVRTLGLIPVAASAPTILSSSQRLTTPIAFVIMKSARHDTLRERLSQVTRGDAHGRHGTFKRGTFASYAGQRRLPRRKSRSEERRVG